MSSKARFDRKTAQKFAVVHRPHDDPKYHDPEASEHILVPIKDAKKQLSFDAKKARSPFAKTATNVEKALAHDHVGEAALYGIGFDDSKYDYTQHLKPVGLDPQNSVFIPASSGQKSRDARKLKAEDLFAELGVEDASQKKNESMFERGGVAKREYLTHQQDVEEELRGFRPDMNPALREVLEALEDEAYVVNKDTVVTKKEKPDQKVGWEGAVDEAAGGDDDLFDQLLMSGQADDAEQFENEFDEWDVDHLEDYEAENYRDEMEQFDKIENYEDLQNIDYQADVQRFKQHQSRKAYPGDEEDADSVNDFDRASDDVGSLDALSEDGEDKEELDTLGDLPQIKTSKKPSKSNSKSRRKKGAMSDVSGFSMSSSAIARSEAMTILDDRYDHIISGYENYEEEQEEQEEDYQPFDISNERADFESLLDDFLENYELESGGRKLVKKNHEAARFQRAADEVSKGKLSQRRNKQRTGKSAGVETITGGLNSLKF
ncbi:LADA_0E08328g1_1 [Lachancea dasiensis]|uniref:LADA_0E08328g1_1 n=1 Tax=Lachancea dasiensis TaxID=1072105 RepID=A0A1G4JD92_9SACH|nr:LADA_0E08328g1_1 [Lachancea dasiensis]